MTDSNKVLCVQVFGLIEVEPGRYVFGFADTYAMPSEVSLTTLHETLLRLGAVKSDTQPVEWS